jgi:hypothetical protein
VGHFAGRNRSFTWKRAKRLGNGFYFVRVTMRAPGGVRDSRRIALRKRGSRIRVRPGFHALRKCKLIRFARLTRPVFGGTGRRPLRVSSALSRRGSITVTIRRGKRVVARKRFGAGGTGIRKFTLGAKRVRRLRRGDYTATVVGRAGSTAESVKLTGRRL